MLNTKLQNSNIDCKLSGSTFIQLMFETCTGRITCGNVGDSRAIVGSKVDGMSFTLVAR
jgi:serine/threonine protein phosphatase PrpC